MKKEILRELRNLKRDLSKEVIEIRVFGSRKRGDFSFWSDLDVFILVRERTLSLEKKIDRKIANLELKYLIPIQVVLRELSEWQLEKDYQTPFSREVSLGLKV